MTKLAVKFKSQFESETLDEIRDLAEEGRDIFNRTGTVPANSPQAFAIAALVRLEKEKKVSSWGRDRYHRGQNRDEDQAA